MIGNREMFQEIVPLANPITVTCALGTEEKVGMGGRVVFKAHDGSTKCSGSIHCARKGLLQSMATKLYNPPRNPPINLITAKDRPRFNPLALQVIKFILHFSEPQEEGVSRMQRYLRNGRDSA